MPVLITDFQRQRAEGNTKVCSLRRALAYENMDVVYSFTQKYAVSIREAQGLFTEAKKFLWLMALALHRGEKPPFVTNELIVVDEMWHTFMLFSQAYTQYCRDRYGFYIDHLPTTKAEIDRGRREHRADAAAFKARWDHEVREQLSFIYDHLGSRTVLKWYTTYPRRYSKRRLEELRRLRADRDLAEVAEYARK